MDGATSMKQVPVHPQDRLTRKTKKLKPIHLRNNMKRKML